MDKSVEIFEINNNFIKIEKDLFEPREKYMERVWFILKKIKNGSIDNFDEYVKLSRIYVNVNILGCKYSSDLMNNIAK